MFKQALFITGTTGAGVSTLARRLASRGWYYLSTGDLFRRMGKTIEGESNPVTPESFEPIVKDRLYKMADALETMDNPFIQFVVEKIPRHKNQLEYICHLKDKGWIVNILNLQADHKVRIDRVKVRDSMSSRNVEDDLLKIDFETGQLTSVAVEAEKLHIPFKTIDTTHFDYRGNGNIDLSGLDIMFTAATGLLRNFHLQKYGDAEINNMPVADRMAYRVEEEIKEYRDSIILDKPRNMRVEELVDTLAFLMCCMCAESMYPSELLRSFISKYDINHFRESTGNKPHMDITNG